MPAQTPQILVTNDDGIDSLGLHALARAMVPLGQVTVVAPDREFSGSGAAIGSIFDDDHHVHEQTIDGIDKAWSLSGPPALCVMYAHLGAFEVAPDVIVSGINPGANVGRSVYHSGTVGAALTGRNYGIPGVAVSQAVDTSGVEGQAWGDIVSEIDWEPAAIIGQRVVQALLTEFDAEYQPGQSPVVNVNVPHQPLDRIEGWSWTRVGTGPRRSMTKAFLDPKPGHLGGYEVRMEFGESVELSPEDDTGAVTDRISVTYLSSLHALDRWSSITGKAIASGLDDLLTVTD